MMSRMESGRQKEPSSISYTCSDDDYYFSAKSLLFDWVRIIGLEAFLVHHFIKSQSLERGLEGKLLSWEKAPSILGLEEKSIEKSLQLLKSVGLLKSEDNCLVIIDPADAYIKYKTRQKEEGK